MSEKQNRSVIRSVFIAVQKTMLSLPLGVKQFLAVFMDGFSVLFTVWLAYSFRYETWHIPHDMQWIVYIIAFTLALPVFTRFGLYKSVFRYNEAMAIKQIIKAVFVYGLVFFALLVFMRLKGVPRSIGVLQPMMLFLLLLATREVARFLLNTRFRFGVYSSVDKRLLIYGVGSAGIQLANVIEQHSDFLLVGFIDDDPRFHGRMVNGLKVYSFNDLPRVIDQTAATDILLAIPSASKARRKEILQALQPFPVHVRTLPSLEDLAGGNVSIRDVKDVEIEDLLGRDAVPPDPALFDLNNAGRTVLVSGAGGSIGKELCRQILSAGPKRLLLVDHAEFNLHNVYHALERQKVNKELDTEILPILCNVAEEGRFRSLCNAYKPYTIYHAAAYKHVPMVELNPVEGVRNNVFGTLYAAQVAVECDVHNFILISTDKAVRPANIMGASKRLCEMILQAISNKEGSDSTCFSMVRFGNVLGSSGSVVPLFRQQIIEGGPVTVTHPEITRYFMTISEAAQLVIQAGAMAKGNEVFLLDMGDPVRIHDLAIRMIELSGLTVRDEKNQKGDIPIEFIGLRPGEKLYEELLIGDNPKPTAHPRIFKAHEEFIAWPELMRLLVQLADLVEMNDAEKIRRLLQEHITDFHPHEPMEADEPVPYSSTVEQR